MNKNRPNKMSRQDVYKAIDSEREYQDRIWNETTTASEGIHSPEEWYTYISDYVSEAQHILSRKSVQDSYSEALNIMRKVAGMAVCAMEQHGVKERE